MNKLEETKSALGKKLADSLQIKKSDDCNYVIGTDIVTPVQVYDIVKKAFDERTELDDIATSIAALKNISTDCVMELETLGRSDAVLEEIFKLCENALKKLGTKPPLALRK